MEPKDTDSRNDENSVSTAVQGAKSKVNFRARIALAFALVLMMAFAVWKGGLLRAFADEPWVVVVIGVVVAALSVIVLLTEDKLSDVLKPVIGVIALSLTPAIYQQVKESAAKAERAQEAQDASNARKREQVTRVAADVAALRAAIVQFMSQCSPRAMSLLNPASGPPERGRKVDWPHAFRQHLSAPACAAKYDEIVRGWISATWTYRLLAPFLFEADNCSVDAARRQLDGGVLSDGGLPPLDGGVESLPEEVQNILIACRLLQRENTDRVSKHYRKFVNAYTDCCPDKPAATALGDAGIELFHHTRRFGCALVFATPGITSSSTRAAACERYMQASAAYLPLDDGGARLPDGGARLPDGGAQLPDEPIASVDDENALALERWWSAADWP